MNSSKINNYKLFSEKLLASKKSYQTPINQDFASLNLELDVYHIELELQNVELLNTCAQLSEYQQLFDYAPVPYVILDENANIENANYSLATLLAVTRVSLLYSSFSQYILPEDQDIFYFYRQALINQQKPKPCQLRLSDPSGKIIWTQCTRFLNVTATAPKLHLAFTDITDLKNEEFLTSILDSFPDTIAVINREGIIVFVNKMWRKFAIDNAKPSGNQANHIDVGDNYLEVLKNSTGFSAEGADEALNGIMDVLAGKIPEFNLVYPCHSPNQKRWYRMHVTALQDASQCVVIKHSSIADIPEMLETISDKEKEFHFLAESMPQIVWICRADGQNIYFNHKWQEYTGLTLEESHGDGWLKPFHPDHQQRAWHAWQNAVDNNAEYSLECLLRQADGVYRWWLIRGMPAFDEHGKIYKWFGTCTDIHAIKLTEHQLRIAASAFESQQGIMITDAFNTILQVNKAFSDITGYSAQEIIGQNPRILKSGRQDKAFYQAMWESIKKTGGWEGEIWNRRKRGDIYLEHIIITAVKDANDDLQNYVTTFSDITMSRSVNEEIKHLAFYDPLTQLPNRRLFIDRLEKAMVSCARRGKMGALLFLDLDNFKKINDSLGHFIGDLLLQEVAERLKLSVREEDTVARFGGDEFVVMLIDLSDKTPVAAAQAQVIAEKILNKFSQPYLLDNQTYAISCSLGVALFSDHEETVEDIIKHADIAMYQAKKAGCSTFRFFDPQMKAAIKAYLALETELRSALEQNQFQLYYQIQVDSTQRALGAEVLIRWFHPERGLVSPAQFIPIAEETGLIITIGLWVLESACAQLQTWQQDKLTCALTLSVNVSAKQYRQTDFVAQVASVIQRYAINPKFLKLELTESILIEDIEAIIVTMKSLSEMGIQFSLDDFGTGYSSLQYLKRLPLYQLKIDQSFVRDITVDNNDKEIVITIIRMAQAMNLHVIAEGVETEQQRYFLEQQECLAYQGYLFGKPMPIDQFEVLLKNTAALTK